MLKKRTTKLKSQKSLKKSGKKTSAHTYPSIGIVMGSDSDLPTMKGAIEILKQFGIAYDVSILSIHRTPREVSLYAETARERGLKVIIAGAGGAAHLPGVIASYTELPVIGVPVAIGALQGQDALYSIVQMPKGVPVATVAIGNATNAGILAAQILGVSSERLLDDVASYKEQLRRMIVQKNEKIKKDRI